jgi:lysozyme
MKINRAGLELIKNFEGFVPNAYLCPAGIWTIGYGTTTAAGAGEIRKGMTITKDQASDMLLSTLVKYEAAVTKALTQVPTENQFSAMVSLCYNIGESAFAKSTVLRKFNSGDLSASAAAFRMWNKAGGKVLPGLIRRREAELALFSTPAAKGEPPVIADFETPEPSTSKGLFNMTSEQVGAIVRTVVQLVAGLAIAKGIGDDALWMTIGGAAASVVSGVWSFFWIKKAST